MSEHEKDQKKALKQKLQEAEDVNPSDLEPFSKKMAKPLGKLKQDTLQALKELWGDIQVLSRLTKSYINKDYTNMPISTMVSVAVSFLYLASPIDLILDKIPLVGYFDDAAMVSLCLKLIKKDITDFQQWEESTKNDTEVS